MRIATARKRGALSAAIDGWSSGGTTHTELLQRYASRNDVPCPKREDASMVSLYPLRFVKRESKRG
jgi:hypothetical protein